MSTEAQQHLEASVPDGVVVRDLGEHGHVEFVEQPRRGYTNRRDDVSTDDLVVAYESGETLAAIGRRFGINAETVRLRLIKRGVELRSRANHGPRNGRWAGDRVSDNTGRQRAARVLVEAQPCSVCGSLDHPHRHHVDGDTSNNSPANLVWLCATCHTKQHRDAERREARGIYWAWGLRETWRAEYSAGATVAEIARRHKVSAATVARHLDALGVRPSKRVAP